ncbi:hypothetical protein [Agromyces sp. NPDC055661]|jgi:hypothetical protein
MNASRSSRPRVAYVVLTHADWPQVRRLVDAIRSSSPDAFVLIAHDARRESFPDEPVDPRVEVFEHGLAADWGSWELVEATLVALDRVRTRVDPDLVCVVSGQDYPARRLSAWESEALSAGSWIGTASPLRYTPHWGRRLGDGDDALTRYSHRWFQTPAARRGIRLDGCMGRAWRRVRDAVTLRTEPVLSVRVLERGRGVFYGIRRARSPFSAEQPCFQGSQWIALRRVELDRLLDVDLARGSRLRRLYEHSVIPDESALVTPLAWRAAASALAPVTHVEWDDARDQPAVCTLDHLEAILASGSPFCRKVDSVVSAPLMDELDRITAAVG